MEIKGDPAGPVHGTMDIRDSNATEWIVHLGEGPISQSQQGEERAVSWFGNMTLPMRLKTNLHVDIRNDSGAVAVIGISLFEKDVT